MLIYIETNFILGIATGREISADQLLSRANTERKIMMSSICFLEAIVALEGQQNQLNKLIESLNITIGEIQRSPQQRSSNEMSALTASKDAATNLLNQLKPSLSAAIEKVLCVAEVITPSVNSVQKTLNNPILKRNKALRDNLILQFYLRPCYYTVRYYKSVS